MKEKWDEIQRKLDLVRVSRECELSKFKVQGFCPTSKGKKPDVNRANNFCRKIRAEGSVTFQNIFSHCFLPHDGDFSDLVSVMPCTPPE